MIKTLTRAFLINIFALWLVAQYVGGFVLAHGIESLLLVGAGFTALHLLIRPILGLFLGVLNFLTLGLVGLAVDAVLLYGLTLYFPQIVITAWTFPGLVINGFIVPATDFSNWEVMILAAFIIGAIRSILMVLV